MDNKSEPETKKPLMIGCCNDQQSVYIVKSQVFDQLQYLDLGKTKYVVNYIAEYINNNMEYEGLYNKTHRTSKYDDQCAKYEIQIQKIR